jgi:multicomponent Na+:H+ antiporter subunit F
MNKNRLRWLLGTIILAVILALILFKPSPILFYPDLPHIPLITRALHILLLSCLFCLYRIVKGPTAADRVVAIDILGILIVGFCAILGIATGRSWYMDIGIAWALQSFIATIALAKYLEGKNFDE